MRRSLALTFVLAVGGTAALASRGDSRPLGDVSEWNVTGVHTLEGPYSGTARITVDDGERVRMEVSVTTRKGRAITWRGQGRLSMGDIKIKMDQGGTGITGALAGTDGGRAEGHAAYVVTDEKTIGGYWRIAREGARRPSAGGNETLTFRSGKPFVATPRGLPPPRLPDDALPVPLVTQPDDFSCGAASLESILFYYRVWDGDLVKLYRPLRTDPEVGTDQGPIVKFARSRSLAASYRSGSGVGLSELRRSLARREPVMLLIQAWRTRSVEWRTDMDDGHWVVLIGTDAHYAYFMDPSAHFGYGYMPLDELLERWHHEDDVGRGRIGRVEHGAIFFDGQEPTKNPALVRIQ